MYTTGVGPGSGQEAWPGLLLLQWELEWAGSIQMQMQMEEQP